MSVITTANKPRLFSHTNLSRTTDQKHQQSKPCRKRENEMPEKYIFYVVKVKMPKKKNY